MTNSRFERQVRLFGEKGQEELQKTSVAVVGVGGLGTHVVQQLALLGVGRLVLIDSEELADTNRNRYVGVRHDDPVPGSPKVDLGERLAHSIDPEIEVLKVADSFISDAGFQAMRSCDWIFGCLDKEGPRVILNEFCAAYSKPYIDLATGIDEDDGQIVYGGRVVICTPGAGCLVCFDELDTREAEVQLGGPDRERLHEAIYGVQSEFLGRTGPSVVSLNGVIASLGVVEFMVAVTGLRKPERVKRYYGHDAVLRKRSASNPPLPDCFICGGVFNLGESAEVERYIRAGYGKRL